MSRRQINLAVCASALIAGCGGESWQAKTYPAGGRVTINGEAPVGALVQLYPIGAKVDARDSRPWGRVRSDGSYTLATYEDGEGAPPGEYALTVTWPVDPKIPSPADRLQNKYARPDQSSWRVTIKEGDNTIDPVAITGATVDAPATSSSRRGPAGPPMPGLTRKESRPRGR